MPKLKLLALALLLSNAALAQSSSSHYGDHSFAIDSSRREAIREVREHHISYKRETGYRIDKTGLGRDSEVIENRYAYVNGVLREERDMSMGAAGPGSSVMIYDPFDRVLSAAEGGSVITYRYDDAQGIALRSQSAGVDTFWYSQKGEILRQCVKGIFTFRRFDSKGRLTAETESAHANKSGLLVSNASTYGYDISNSWAITRITQIRTSGPKADTTLRIVMVHNDAINHVRQDSIIEIAQDGEITSTAARFDSVTKTERKWSARRAETITEYREVDRRHRIHTKSPFVELLFEQEFNDKGLLTRESIQEKPKSQNQSLAVGPTTVTEYIYQYGLKNDR